MALTDDFEFEETNDDDFTLESLDDEDEKRNAIGGVSDAVSNNPLLQSILEGNARDGDEEEFTFDEEPVTAEVVDNPRRPRRVSVNDLSRNNRPDSSVDTPVYSFFQSPNEPNPFLSLEGWKRSLTRPLQHARGGLAYTTALVMLSHLIAIPVVQWPIAIAGTALGTYSIGRGFWNLGKYMRRAVTARNKSHDAQWQAKFTKSAKKKATAGLKAGLRRLGIPGKIAAFVIDVFDGDGIGDADPSNKQTIDADQLAAMMQAIEKIKKTDDQS